MHDLPDNRESVPWILVCDDDKNVVAYLQALLETVPYHVIACQSGAEALAAAEKLPVDLVLLDVVMPRLDGFAVAKRMKEHFGANDFVPIIMISGLTSPDKKIAGLVHADDFITKPFNQDELLARIRVMLRIRQLQRDLLISKSNYQFLYENAPSMYLTVDGRGTVTDCNTLFCTTTGARRDGIVGADVASFFRDEDRKALREFLDEAGSHGEGPPQPTLALLSATGGEGDPVYVMCNAVSTGAGVMVAMQDVTQNIKLEHEQKLARTQLYRSARLASIGTFASGVAHELNNPLTAVLGFSGALLERIRRNEGIDSDELEQYLTIINSETVRCSEIVENLSLFAREGEARIGDFALAECVEGALRLVNSLAAKKQVAITKAVPAEVRVRADIRKLQQAIVHIITNSLDFCNKGSTVVLEAFPDDVYVKLCISDNGPGIAPEMLTKVFDPFFSTKDVGQGTGMGLAMCHVIMEECNGGIDVISEKGKGTTVVLDIPAVPSAERAGS
jgi:PAS domain S-box-containing protein